MFNVHVTVSPLEHLNVTGAMGPGPQNAVHGGSHLKQQAEIESLKMQLSLMQSKGEAVAPNVIWQQSN